MSLKPSRVAIALVFLATALSGCASEKEKRESGELPDRAPVSRADMAPESYVFLPYKGPDGSVTQQGRDQAVADTWQKIAGNQDTMSLMDLRDSLTRLHLVNNAYFNPVEFDPQDRGKVTKENFAHALNNRFSRLDRNGDGTLEAREFAPLPRNMTYEQKRSDDSEPAMTPAGGGYGPSGMGHGGY